MAYANVENRSLEKVASCSHAKQVKMARNAMVVGLATHLLDYAHARKVLPGKLVNYNATKNVTIMAVALQKHPHGLCAIASQVLEVLAVKSKSGALEMEQTVRATEMVIV